MMSFKPSPSTSTTSKLCGCEKDGMPPALVPRNPFACHVRECRLLPGESADSAFRPVGVRLHRRHPRVLEPVARIAGPANANCVNPTVAVDVVRVLCPVAERRAREAVASGRVCGRARGRVELMLLVERRPFPPVGTGEKIDLAVLVVITKGGCFRKVESVEILANEFQRPLSLGRCIRATPRSCPPRSPPPPPSRTAARRPCRAAGRSQR